MKLGVTFHILRSDHMALISPNIHEFILDMSYFLKINTLNQISQARGFFSFFSALRLNKVHTRRVPMFVHSFAGSCQFTVARIPLRQVLMYTI